MKIGRNGNMEPPRRFLCFVPTAPRIQPGSYDTCDRAPRAPWLYFRRVRPAIDLGATWSFHANTLYFVVMRVPFNHLRTIRNMMNSLKINEWKINTFNWLQNPQKFKIGPRVRGPILDFLGVLEPIDGIKAPHFIQFCGNKNRIFGKFGAIVPGREAIS